MATPLFPQRAHPSEKEGWLDTAIRELATTLRVLEASSPTRSTTAGR